MENRFKNKMLLFEKKKTVGASNLFHHNPITCGLTAIFIDSQSHQWTELKFNGLSSVDTGYDQCRHRVRSVYTQGTSCVHTGYDQCRRRV